MTSSSFMFISTAALFVATEAIYSKLDLSLILRKVVFLLFLMISLRALFVSKHGRRNLKIAAKLH